VTGWEVTGAELEDVARRVVDVRKAFNIREGWKPEDDTLPARFLDEPLADGASAGARIPRERLREMIRSYNLARGWTEQGYLPAAVLQDLGVDT
jgi:aldehyde:ferredoxin oxidoreductase